MKEVIAQFYEKLPGSALLARTLFAFEDAHATKPNPPREQKSENSLLMSTVHKLIIFRGYI